MQKRKESKWLNWFMLLLLAIPVLGMLGFMCRLAYRDMQERSPEWKTKFQKDFPGLEAATSLTPGQRELVVRKANVQMCSCRCGYTVASCLKLDSSCPNRPANLQRVKDFIQEAQRAGMNVLAGHANETVARGQRP